MITESSLHVTTWNSMGRDESLFIACSHQSYILGKILQLSQGCCMQISLPYNKTVSPIKICFFCFHGICILARWDTRAGVQVHYFDAFYHKEARFSKEAFCLFSQKQNPSLNTAGFCKVKLKSDILNY